LRRSIVLQQRTATRIDRKKLVELNRRRIALLEEEMERDLVFPFVLQRTRLFRFVANSDHTKVEASVSP